MNQSVFLTGLKESVIRAAKMLEPHLDLLGSISGADIELLLDNYYGNTDWRDVLTGAEIATLLTNNYGSEYWNGLRSLSKVHDGATIIGMGGGQYELDLVGNDSYYYHSIDTASVEGGHVTLRSIVESGGALKPGYTVAIMADTNWNIVIVESSNIKLKDSHKMVLTGDSTDVIYFKYNAYTGVFEEIYRRTENGIYGEDVIYFTETQAIAALGDNALKQGVTYAIRLNIDVIIIGTAVENSHFGTTWLTIPETDVNLTIKGLFTSGGFVLLANDMAAIYDGTTLISGSSLDISTSFGIGKFSLVVTGSELTLTDVIGGVPELELILLNDSSSTHALAFDGGSGNIKGKFGAGVFLAPGLKDFIHLRNVNGDWIEVNSGNY